MDVLNLLRSRTPWGFRGGGSEMQQELQEVQKHPLSREDSFSSSEENQSQSAKSQSVEREPLSACVVNHPRFGTSLSFKEENSTESSSSLKGPRAAPSENELAIAFEGNVEGMESPDSSSLRGPRAAPSANGLAIAFDDSVESRKEGESPSFSSLRIADRLLPTENAVYETESEASEDEMDPIQPSVTSFSPPVSQSIDRDSNSPFPYPKILSRASRDAVYAEREAVYAQRDAVYAERHGAYSERDAFYEERETNPRRIKATSSEAENRSLAFVSPARKERLRKQKEATEKIQQEMKEVGVLMEALLAQNPALQSPEAPFGAPLEIGELELLRSKCGQQEEELALLRAHREDVQAQCCTSQERCALLERENQQMQSQLATLKWQLSLQEEFRFLTPPPNLSTQERELWRKKLLKEKLMVVAEKTWQSTGPVRKLALDEAEGIEEHEAAPESPDVSAVYLAAVKDARRNPTPEKLAFAAKARSELGVFLGGSKSGPFVRSDSLEEVQLKIRTENPGKESCELHSPRSLIRNLSASAEFVMRDASVKGPVLAVESSETDLGNVSHATIHTPLDRGNAVVATPTAITPLFSLATPEEGLQ